MTDFVTAVREALESIPHDNKCASHNGYPMLAIPGEIPYKCDCDREERVAQRVAAAMREASKRSYWHDADWRDHALGVLQRSS